MGATILTYLPNGNPLTLESTLYGLAAAVMLITVISWFSCFNAVMTGDKLVYLFGRVLPGLSLLLAMALRFVPRFQAQIKVISTAQKGIKRDVASGTIMQKARQGMKILSIMVTWALENGVETADSMKGRGYGLPGRTAFSIFRFRRRDGWVCLYLLTCAAVVITGAAAGAYQFRYFPTVRGQWSGFWTIAVFGAYFALAALPIIINLKEELRWKRIESKI
jgi:energy-coupling factor transport system permease protein